MKKYILSLIDLLYPRQCIVDGGKPPAGKNEFPLCESCLAKVKLIISKVCPKCGNPLYGESDTASAQSFICKKCAPRKTSFGALRSACVYEGLIKDCIHLFKYKKKLQLKRFFAKLLRETFHLHFSNEKYDLITEVPMHPLKKFFKEFNHCEILARDLSRHTGIKHAKNALRRVKLTSSQTLLTSTQRKNNVKGAFKASKRARIKDKKILLIDDVATTLSTADECAKALLNGGAKAVDVLTLARG